MGFCDFAVLNNNAELRISILVEILDGRSKSEECMWIKLLFPNGSSGLQQLIKINLPARSLSWL